MLGPLLPVLSIVAIALTAAAAVGLDVVLKGARPVVAVLASGLLLPVLLSVGTIILARPDPDPRSIDGAAYVMLGGFLTALLSVPLSLGIGALAVWLARRIQRS